MVTEQWRIACSKRYNDQGREFQLHVEIELKKGSFTAVMGPSGAGKTTFLRLLAGLEKPDAGTIEAANVCWYDSGRFTPPQQRQTGYVFQNYALFPHMTVRQNIRYGLKNASDTDWYNHLLAIFKIEALQNDKPQSLSGGQQQRVALARALASRPQLLLLDEPMTALDFGLRNEVRRELKQVTGEMGLTVVLVTHDVLEAATLAHHVIWIQDGKIAREGEPAIVLKEELTQIGKQADAFLQQAHDHKR